MIQRLKALLQTRKGRIVVVVAAAAVLGLIVAQRRRASAAAAGAPMTADQVAADPRSSAILGTDGGPMYADYGGGSIGGGGFGGGSDIDGSTHLDWLAGISEQLEGLQSSMPVAPTQEGTVTSPTAPLPHAPVPSQSVAKFPGAKTFTDSKGNVRQVGTGTIIKPAGAVAQAKPATVVGNAGASPGAKTFADASGNVRQIGTGVIVTRNPPPRAPVPAPVKKPATVVSSAGARPGAKTFKDGAGNIRQVGTGKILKKG